MDLFYFLENRPQICFVKLFFINIEHFKPRTQTVLLTVECRRNLQIKKNSKQYTCIFLCSKIWLYITCNCFFEMFITAWKKDIQILEVSCIATGLLSWFLLLLSSVTHKVALLSKVCHMLGIFFNVVAGKNHLNTISLLKWKSRDPLPNNVLIWSPKNYCSYYFIGINI